MDILTIIVINHVDVINRSLFTNILTILFLLSMKEVKLFSTKGPGQYTNHTISKQRLKLSLCHFWRFTFLLYEVV